MNSRLNWITHFMGHAFSSSIPTNIDSRTGDAITIKRFMNLNRNYGFSEFVCVERSVQHPMGFLAKKGVRSGWKNAHSWFSIKLCVFYHTLLSSCLSWSIFIHINLFEICNVWMEGWTLMLKERKGWKARKFLYSKIFTSFTWKINIWFKSIFTQMLLENKPQKRIDLYWNVVMF